MILALIPTLALAAEPASDTTPDALAEALRAGPGPAWTTERIALRATETSPDIEAAVAGFDRARAAAEAAWAEALPRTELSARYTRVSAIDNAPLIALSFDIDQARAAAGQLADPAAQSLWNAQIDQLDALRTTTIDVPQNQYALRATAEYPVTPLFFEILPAIRAREAGADAAELEADVARRDVALGAVETFLQHARARGAAIVAETAVREARQSLAEARARLERGTGSRPDVLRFEARVAEALGDAAEREADVTATSEALRTLLELDGRGPLAFAEPITESPADPFPGRDADDLVAAAWDARPELAAAEALVRSGERARGAERGAALPRLLISGQLDYAQPNALFVPPNEDFQGSWSASAVIAWSPDGAWAATRRARGAAADVIAVEAQHERIRRAIRIEVTREAARYRAAELGLDAALDGRAAADEALRARRRGYELGVFDATDLVDAELDASRARLAVVDAGVDARIRKARLRRAVGEALWRAPEGDEP
jgi:cobalt-zinc-cadmium efflux system outer membrane protein